MALSIPFHASRADDAPDFGAATLTGDWGGARTELYRKGIDIEVNYIVDSWRNIDGGLKTGNSVLGHMGATVAIDGSKLYGIEGSTVFFHVIDDRGGHPNNYVGSFGGLDNAEVGTPTFKLFEAWIAQDWLDGTLSTLAGLYDLNSEFYVTDSSGLFLNPTYGIGTEMASTGINGPSVFPTASVAARLRYNPAADLYVQAAVLDAISGDPDHPRGTHIRLNGADGALLVGEAGYKNDATGHFAVGAWTYTSPFDDQTDLDGGGNPVRRHNSGVYALAETTLYRDSGDKDRKIDGFIRAGTAGRDVSPYGWSAATGMVYSGIIPGRADSQAGLAVAVTADDKKFRTASGGGLDEYETQIELTYADKLTPWLTIQPDVQYTVNPGGNRQVDNALSAALRVGIDF